MSVYISSLNSGSNGNCYYIGSDEEAVLVDAGISCRETEKRMRRSGLSMDKVKAIFVSHEHSDHISGIRVLAKKYSLPIYVTAGTAHFLGLPSDQYQIRPFRAGEPVQVGKLTVKAFVKAHDACDPHSFIISASAVNIGVFTDIGVVCEQLRQHFSQCHAAFLEANYDEAMLENGSYPYHLKKRIRGGNGHLSNRQAMELVAAHRPPFMSHLLLSHLSKNNNCPDLVRSMFSRFNDSTEIVVASRYEETPVFHITSDSTTEIHIRRSMEKPEQFQLCLF